MRTLLTVIQGLALVFSMICFIAYLHERLTNGPTDMAHEFSQSQMEAIVLVLTCDWCKRTSWPAPE